jgi:hypothetical protein
MRKRTKVLTVSHSNDGLLVARYYRTNRGWSIDNLKMYRHPTESTQERLNFLMKSTDKFDVSPSVLDGEVFISVSRRRK